MQANNVNVLPPTKVVPPILEKEDHSVIQRPISKTPEPSALLVAGRSQPRAVLPQTAKAPIKSDVPPLGIERPEPTIDNHDHFWSTYDRVANAYDRETLDAWNKSLDVLLIFAGLFSAINTAFIIEAYKGLQPDPTETTNALLRLFIMHRTDNQTLSLEELNPGSPASSSYPINSLFFSSLSFSLTAAFGAVTAKQWLTEYSNVGAVKALHVQGRTRQEKYKGLKTWQLQLIIESLPLLLQASLFLFLVGIVRFLWDMNGKVAALQLALSGFGVTIYVITIIIGILVPTSPFQTPLSKYIPLCFTQFRLFIVAISLQTKTLFDCAMGWIQLMRAWFDKSIALSVRTHLQSFLEPISSMKREIVNKAQSSTVAKHVRLLRKRCSLRKKETTQSMSKAVRAGTVEGLQTSAGLPVSAVRQWLGSSIFQRKPTITSEPDADKSWSRAEVTAAEAVVWLLEQAEHPDVILIALDAVPRLPSELLLSIIEKQGDLLGRLIRFHNGLLPVTKPTRKNQSWVKSWPNTAVVSGTALWHILKIRNWGLGDLKSDPLMQTIDSSDDWKFPMSMDSITTTKFLLCHYFGFSVEKEPGSMHISHITRNATAPGGRSAPLSVKLMDARQPPIGGTFSTQLSSIHLTLDALIHVASATVGNEQFSNLRTVFNTIIASPAWKGPLEIPRSIISHFALAMTAVYAPGMIDDAWSYPTVSEREHLAQLVRESFRIVDKGKMILENTASALSLVDTFSTSQVTEWNPFRYLLRITAALFVEAHTNINNPISFPNFAQCILRLGSKYPSDRVLLLQVLQVLGVCPDGDWLSPFNEKYGGHLFKAIGLLMEAEPGLVINPGDPAIFKLLNKMADFLDDGQFIRALEEETGLFLHLPSIPRLLKTVLVTAKSPFIEKVLMLQVDESSKPQELLSLQFSVAVAALERLFGKAVLPVFFNKLLEEDGELCWPSYFISAEIVSADAQAKDGAQSVAPLRYIDPKHLSELLGKPITPASKVLLWHGEAVMLLLKKTRREHAKGRLPPTWKDSAFFTFHMIGHMMTFYRIYKEQKYSGTDLELLKAYFFRALDELKPTQEVQSLLGPTNKIKEMRRKDLKTMLLDFDVSSSNDLVVTNGESSSKT
ncbi:hypothetical protein FRC02_012070 [Tulasnella sp. 418]|nr:hypothetical protein FRC02_012070 [Tulasnella sp. 418]